MKRYAMDAEAEFGQDAWAVERESSIGAWVRHDEAAAELARLRAEVERLTAALADERAHADAMAEVLTTAGEALSSVCPGEVG